MFLKKNCVLVFNRESVPHNIKNLQSFLVPFSGHNYEIPEFPFLPTPLLYSIRFKFSLLFLIPLFFICRQKIQKNLMEPSNRSTFLLAKFSIHLGLFIIFLVFFGIPSWKRCLHLFNKRNWENISYHHWCLKPTQVQCKRSSYEDRADKHGGAQASRCYYLPKVTANLTKKSNFLVKDSKNISRAARCL